MSTITIYKKWKIIECPICMDVIDQNSNLVITECGHSFHCSCLMKNTAHNGFGCPNCRTMMAELPNYEDDSEDSDNDSEDSEDSEEDNDSEEDFNNNYSAQRYSAQREENNVLASFRMFHQQLNGEEVEEYDEEQNDMYVPTERFVLDNLVLRDVRYEDLLRYILFTGHHSCFMNMRNPHRLKRDSRKIDNAISNIIGEFIN